MSCAELLMLEGRKTVISASIGMASDRGPHAIGAEDMLREADAAMYHAKRSGKNTCVVFDPSMHATASGLWSYRRTWPWR